MSDCPNSIKFSCKRVASYSSATLVSLVMTTTIRDRRVAVTAPARNVTVFFFLDTADDVNKKRQSRATGIKQAGVTANDSL